MKTPLIALSLLLLSLPASHAAASTLTECEVTGTLVQDLTTGAGARELGVQVTASVGETGASDVCDPLVGRTVMFEPDDASFTENLLLVGATVSLRYALSDDEESGATSTAWEFLRTDVRAPHCIVNATFLEAISGNRGAPIDYLFSEMHAAPGQDCSYVASVVTVQSRERSFYTPEMTRGDTVQLRRYTYAGTDGVMHWERVFEADAP